MIQFGNSSVEIRWVIQDGKVLHCFSSRCYHWLYGTVSWWDYYYFFQVNFSLHSFVISYEHRLQPDLNFIQDETFWVCNFTLLKSVFEFVFMSEYSEHFFVSSLIYSYLASLGPQSCRKRVVLGSLSNNVFERRRSTGSGLFSFFDGGFAQIFSQIASITVKKLRNTNFISSRYVKRENTSLLVDVRRSKTLLLKLPI